LHSCSGPDSTPLIKNSDAGRALLAKHFPSANTFTISARTPRVSKVSSDPKKRAQLQKVELMKMRHRATPGDPNDKSSSVLVDQRLHVKVKLDNPEQKEREGMFWFRKLAPAKPLTALPPVWEYYHRIHLLIDF
jgi:hypothetical protein